MGRIEYIDALRGFTMFLVVLGHCMFFIFKDHTNEYIYIAHTIRMPLFFFISGFVFYKCNVQWDMTNIKNFLYKKIKVQIISPFIFLLIYLYMRNISFVDSMLDENKSGYWFTFALFEYFILFIIIENILNKLHLNSTWRDISLFTISLLILLGLNHHIRIFPIYTTFKLLGICHWNLFVYFVLGTLTKKYFKEFESALDNSNLTLYSVLIFVCFNIFPIHSIITEFIKGLAGIIIVFALFRKYADCFKKENKIGSMMQFIGKRTLDIYLLHYFVLPWGMEDIPIFLKSDSLMSLFSCVIISIVVISVCLLISTVLRLNPLMAQFLFGEKKS